MTDPRRRAVARKILLAYLGLNEVPWADVPALEASIRDALARLPVKPTPEQVAASIRPEGLVSFIDGRAYKVLKRHLRAHGLDPGSYCERYGLPADYPMAAPSYGARRAEIALAIGLGGSRPDPDGRRRYKRPSAR